MHKVLSQCMGYREWITALGQVDKRLKPVTFSAPSYTAMYNTSGGIGDNTRYNQPQETYAPPNRSARTGLVYDYKSVSSLQRCIKAKYNDINKWTYGNKVFPKQHVMTERACVAIIFSQYKIKCMNYSTTSSLKSQKQGQNTYKNYVIIKYGHYLTVSGASSP